MSTKTQIEKDFISGFCYLSEHEIRCDIYQSNEGPLASLTTPPALLAQKIKCSLGPLNDINEECKLKVEIEAKEIDVNPSSIETKDREKILIQFRENILDVGRFPKILFEGTVDDRTLGEKNFRGRLTLHGECRDLSFSLKEDSPLRYSGHVVIRQSDFGIHPLSVLGGALKNRDEVLIVITVSFPPWFAYVQPFVSI